MLGLLVRYAHEHDLEIEPGFRIQDVRWAVVSGADGQYLGVVSLGDPAIKRNPGRRFPKCPDLGRVKQGRTKDGGNWSDFLVETADVVTLLFDPKADEKARQKVESKHQCFVEMLSEAGRIVPDIGKIAMLLTDADSLTAMRKDLLAGECRPLDKVTFQIQGVFPLDGDAWHPWWRDFRARLTPALSPGGGGLMRCFGTGELVEPAVTHDKIKGLGGTVQPAMVCFDKESVGSYGLMQSANAAFSQESMTAYCRALNDLVEKHSLPFAGCRVVYWFKEKVEPEDDILSFLVEGDEQKEQSALARARSLLKGICEGNCPNLYGNRYYSLVLSPSGGRVMVRDWMEGAFEVVVKCVLQWFNDLEIDGLDGQRIRVPGIDRVLTSLLRPRGRDQDYGKWIEPIAMVRQGFWTSILHGTPLPGVILGRLVLTNTRFHQVGVLEEAEKKRQDIESTRVLLSVRMALLKACLLRQSRNQGGGSMETDLKPELNEAHPDPAYHCGRLMAVLAAIQHSALGDVGAGVVQRYYAAASATPALVFGRLVRTAQAHLGKLPDGLAHWYEGRLSEVANRIGDNVPRTLDLEEQSLFALGYYQQMAALRTRKPVETPETTKEA